MCQVLEWCFNRVVGGAFLRRQHLSGDSEEGRGGLWVFEARAWHAEGTAVAQPGQGEACCA